ncbi:MAG: helix-turn-helix transcriptional regulator [Peptostreptococcaceae bacterium]|nr:helix-turn-helix transcriptional regulator [Peptostreptococcaceae bacterium]
MLCNKLREIRVKRGLTQEELAKAAYVSQSSICYIEKGKMPRMDTLQKICEALEIQIQELIEKDEE